jgi:SAM-dependent methyltransferase
MNETDIQNYIRRYTEGLREHGYSAQALGWGVNGRQDVRFKVLSEQAVLSKGSSVLDVGCGFADLYRYLKSKDWNGKYTGIDIVPAIADKAKELLPEVDIRIADISNPHLEKYDYVIASGIFNAKLLNEDNLTHISNSINRMFELCNKAVCVDFMSSYVDFQKDGGWHTSPEWAYQLGRTLSKRLLLRSDYLPFEFTLIIFKDDSLSNRNVFNEFEIQLP